MRECHGVSMVESSTPLKYLAKLSIRLSEDFVSENTAGNTEFRKESSGALRKTISAIQFFTRPRLMMFEQDYGFFRRSGHHVEVFLLNNP